jgi:hypothetical protein
MSRTRSNSQGSSNPATKYLGWDTQASAWEFYDKENKKSCTSHPAQPSLSWINSTLLRVGMIAREACGQMRFAP